MLITKEMEWVSNWMQENNVSGEPEMIPKKFSSVGHLLLAIITDYSKLHQPPIVGSFNTKSKRMVKVISGDDVFEGEVTAMRWDIDQWAFMVDGEWYCQSEIYYL